MRVLFLHPEDSACEGPWSQQHWDLIVDLGFAAPSTYEEWGRKSRTRILSLHTSADQGEGYQWVNQFFDRGRGKLLDRKGLNWWNILAMESHQDLHAFYHFRRIRDAFFTGAVQPAATRPHRVATIAEHALQQRVQYFRSGSPGRFGRVARVVRSARNLRPSQIAEIAFDKWDSRYRLRRQWIGNRPAHLSDPAVLMPSAYSNVTRSTLAYAAQLPDRKFLLVTTRRNAVPRNLPANVTECSLAAYVKPARATEDESAELTKKWQTFLNSAATESEEFRWAAKAGVWDYVPVHLRHGIYLRDAWSHLLDSEPLTGVLCGDDLNYHTRLPLMLAHRRGLNAVYCSHGALDGGFLFKTPTAESYLVKGEMERDYLRRLGTIRPEKILVAAPGRSNVTEISDSKRDAIVFFSQPLEVASGRMDSMYEELLPRLHSVTSRSGKKLLIKLHPFESSKAREKLVNSILPDARGQVEIVDGPLEEVMGRAWCGLTVDSSVAVECALSRIPFFLCGWLDFMGMGYLQQYARFGAAEILKSPNEIDQIPRMVANFVSSPETLRKLWCEGEPAKLDEIMFGAQSVRVTPCAC